MQSQAVLGTHGAGRAAEYGFSQQRDSRGPDARAQAGGRKGFGISFYWQGSGSQGESCHRQDRYSDPIDPRFFGKDPEVIQQEITVQDHRYVLVKLEGNRQAGQQAGGEIILDVNEQGNWVHGFEVVGGFVDFSVEKAVRPFHPKLPDDPPKPHRRTKGVTYDPEADAAFFFLDYEPSIASSPKDVWNQLMRVSHGVNPTALYGLDHEGGLVWVKIPIADVTGPVDQFLRLLRR